MIESKKSSLSSKILLAYSSLFLALTVWSSIKWEFIALDRLTMAFFCFLFFLIEKKYKIKPLTAFIAGFIFIPHELGIRGLYGSALLNYKPDLLIHFIISICCTYVILDFILNNFSKKFLAAAAIAFTITITFGAFIEVMEYWGFVSFGIGDGYLGFGDGDNSQNFGPWENSSLDTTINFVGSFFAILVYALFSVFKGGFYDKRQDL